MVGGPRSEKLGRDRVESVKWRDQPGDGFTFYVVAVVQLLSHI